MPPLSTATSGFGLVQVNRNRLRSKGLKTGMNWFQKILQSLGLASYDDSSTNVLPVVTVKIVDSFNLGLSQGGTLTLSQLAAKVGASDSDTVVKNIASAYSDAVFARMLEPVSPADVDKYVNEAKTNDPTYEPLNFNNFLEIVCSPGFDTDPLVTALQAWTAVVQFAGRNSDTQDAKIVGTDNKFFPNQEYLSDTKGVNAQAAWDKGADGTGGFIVDIEQGWFLGHQDLPTGITLRQGTNVTGAHGTNVLGILVAQNHKIGIVGLAPSATVGLSSVVEPGPNANQTTIRMPNRIFLSGMVILRGDVLLIEQSVTARHANGPVVELPVEAFWPAFHMIRLVVAHGVVVVEAAGNGAADLDSWTDENGKHIFDPNLPNEFQDSGAIMVAACQPDKTSYPATASNGKGTNFGRRIDCCAHGDLVVTCDFDPSKPTANNLYAGLFGRAPFGGTSSAAAIIAGCCLLIQHLQTLLNPKTPGKLDSRQMRTLLSKPANCGPVGNAGDKIKAMPDLGQIIANEYTP